MSSNLITWSDDVVKRAQSLWADGHSAGAIAKTLGMTRNAVLGKAFRHPEIFKPRGKTGGSATARRIVEKLRGPQTPAAPKAKPEAEVRTPRLPKPEPVALPSSWGREHGERFDLSRFRRDDVTPVAFRAIGRGQCHFPLEAFEVKAGPETLYCAAPVADGDSYCAVHRRLMTGGA